MLIKTILLINKWIIITLVIIEREENVLPEIQEIIKTDNRNITFYHLFCR